MSLSPATHAAARRREPLAFQLLNELAIINQLSQARAGRLLAPGLNMAQFALLNHFSRLGGERSLVRLASAMQVTKAAMTNTVTRLLDKGLLMVRPDPADGRGKLVSLSAAGAAALEMAVAQLSQAMAEMGQVLSEDEVNQLLPPLRRLRAPGWTRTGPGVRPPQVTLPAQPTPASISQPASHADDGQCRRMARPPDPEVAIP